MAIFEGDYPGRSDALETPDATEQTGQGWGCAIKRDQEGLDALETPDATEQVGAWAPPTSPNLPNRAPEAPVRPYGTNTLGGRQVGG